MVFFILPSSSPVWPLAALFAIISNVCFGASVVAMNAYLPSLARASKEVVDAMMELDEASRHGQLPNDVEDSTRDSDEALLLNHGPSEQTLAKQKYSKALSTATSQISSRGIALGYLAGIILLIVALIPVTKLKGSTFSLRLAIGLSGIWWAAFSLPAAAWLPSGKADSASSFDPNEKWTIGARILAAWKRLGGMLRWTEIKKLQHTFRYLAAWFLLSDGMNPLQSFYSQLSGRPRVYHYDLDSSPICQNDPIHAPIITDPDRSLDSLGGDPRVTGLALRAAPLLVQQPDDARNPGHARIPHSTLRLSGILASFEERQLGWTHTPGRDVRRGRIFRSVALFRVSNRSQ
jgi:hypothetical protein